MTIRCPAETIPSQTAQADLNTSNAMSSVSNDSRTQLKLMEQVSAGELKLRRQLFWSRPVGTDCALRGRVSVVLRGALTADTLTLFRDYGYKMNHLIQLGSLLSYNDILAKSTS